MASSTATIPFKPAEYDVVTPYFTIQGSADAIEHYKQAFGATETVRMDGPGGSVAHAELEINGRRVMLSDPMPGCELQSKTALELKNTPVQLVVWVADVDAAFAKALAAGCTQSMPITDMFDGARCGSVTCKYGNKFHFCTQKKDLTPAQMQERFNELFTRTEHSGAENPDLAKNDPKSKHWKPENNQVITPMIICRGARDALEWYTKAFGGKEEWRLLCPVDPTKEPTPEEKDNPGAVNQGLIDVFNGGKVYVIGEFESCGMSSPLKLGGTPVCLCVYVPDVDAAFSKVVNAGAKVVKGIENQFWGDRTAMIEDPFGHRWNLMQHIEEVSPAEMEKRMAAMMAGCDGAKEQGKQCEGDVSNSCGSVDSTDPNLVQPSDPLCFRYVRTLDAPLELVWKAHTEPERLKQWMAPQGYVMTKCDLDFRVGGIQHYRQEKVGGGQEPMGVMWGLITYTAIEPQKSISSRSCFSDAERGIGRHPLAPTWPREMLSTTTFESVGDGKTRLAIDWTPAPSCTEEEKQTFRQCRSGCVAGWNGTFKHLVQYLEKEQK